MLAHPTPKTWHEIYLSIISLFHICRTIRWHFSLCQVKLSTGQWKYKQKEGRIDQLSESPNELIRTCSHNFYFTFCKIVKKRKKQKQKKTKYTPMHTSELSEVTFTLQIAFALFSLGCVYPHFVGRLFIYSCYCSFSLNIQHSQTDYFPNM